MKQARQNQRGFALLLFMIVLIGFVTAGFSGLLNSSLKQKHAEAQAKNVKVLKKAKEALLSYAVNYSVQGDLNKMGKLPCPDVSSATNLEGSQDASCGSRGVNAVGLFPFKSVGLGKIEDSSGECLWYVVSGDYKNSIAANMLNEDTVGYLNLMDENGNLMHGGNEDDFPIALIISPGSALTGQDRTPDAALPECKANYTMSNYLEGGSNIDYSTGLPASPDTLWSFLSSSLSTNLENSDHNDQVIAIYKDELWGRIKRLNDLSFDNSAGTPATPSSIENLTKSLAECIAAYGDSNTLRRLPYPAPLVITDYRNSSNYDDNPSQFGRFPQQVDNSVNSAINPSKFVLDATAAQSWCETKVTTSYDERLWKNWKDHFFYMVSDDFTDATGVAADTSKCSSPNCIKVAGKPDKVAAMVVFAGEVETGKDRIWSWDSAASSVATDHKNVTANYLEGDNATGYGGGQKIFDLSLSPNDYSYCVKYDNTSFLLSAVKCANL